MVKKGFTLIELLIVVSVLAVLSGVVIVVLNPETFKGKSRDARRKTDLTAIQSALEMYYADNSRYPTGTINSGQATWTSSWVTVIGSYITVVPSDPLNTSPYFYYYRCPNVGASCPSYELNAVFENDTVSMANDGGNESGRYEVGTSLTLIPY